MFFFRMLWEEPSLERGKTVKGDCTQVNLYFGCQLVSITIPILIQEECKIECGADCALLCEIFFSCAAPGGEVGHLYEEDEDRHHHHHHEHHEQGDLVADFETQRLRELTQSLTAVIRSLLS